MNREEWRMAVAETLDSYKTDAGEKEVSIKQQARDQLTTMLTKGDRVYGIVRAVSRSGMSRTIDFYVIRDNTPVYLTGYISTLLGLPRAHNGARVHGAGMDMVFATVYDLAADLFGNGYDLQSEVL